MLLLIHGVLQKFEHGILIRRWFGLYDDYVDNGGDQAAFMADVILSIKFRVLCHGRRKARRKLQEIQSQMEVVEQKSTAVLSEKKWLRALIR